MGTPPLVDTSPAAPAAQVPMPTSSNQASNAQALTDAYLESIGLGKRPPSAQTNRQTASPAPQAQQQQQQQQQQQPQTQYANVQPQQTGYHSPSPVNNGPRAPPTPIPLNQQLLNPLIPT